MSTMMSEQYAAIEIRKHVLPTRYGETIYRNGIAIEALLPKALQAELEASTTEYDDAWNVCVANLDPRVEPQVREAGYNRLQLAQDKSIAVSREIDAWLDENVEQLLVEHVAQAREDAAKALALVTKAGEIMAASAQRRRAVSFAGSRKRDLAPTVNLRPDVNLAALLATLNEQAGNVPEYRRVTQAEYNRMLSEGADLELVKVQHTPPSEQGGRPS